MKLFILVFLSLICAASVVAQPELIAQVAQGVPLETPSASTTMQMLELALLGLLLKDVRKTTTETPKESPSGERSNWLLEQLEKLALGQSDSIGELREFRGEVKGNFTEIRGEVSALKSRMDRQERRATGELVKS